MWKLLVCMLLLGILHAEVNGRRNDEFRAAEIKAVKHSKFRRAASGAVFQASIDELKEYGDDIRIPAGKAKTEALRLGNPSRLTDDQRMAVYLYTLDSQFYILLNGKLRKGYDPGKFQAYVDLFMSGLSKIGKRGPMDVWRVVTNTRLVHHDGETVKWPAFSSTSTIEDGVWICKEELALYKIKNAYGYSIKDYSKFPKENEILLPMNTLLEVVKVNSTCEKQRRYDVKIISRYATAIKSMGVSGPVNDTEINSMGVSVTVSLNLSVWSSALIVISDINILFSFD